MSIQSFTDLICITMYMFPYSRTVHVPYIFLHMQYPYVRVILSCSLIT
jgi:hypothetical protein